jgi:hypothetical protein
MQVITRALVLALALAATAAEQPATSLSGHPVVFKAQNVTPGAHNKSHNATDTSGKSTAVGFVGIAIAAVDPRQPPGGPLRHTGACLRAGAGGGRCVLSSPAAADRLRLQLHRDQEEGVDPRGRHVLPVQHGGRRLHHWAALPLLRAPRAAAAAHRHDRRCGLGHRQRLLPLSGPARGI